MRGRSAQLAGIGVCTVAAILVHGYHPYVEDAAIYVPGIKKILDPALYPHNQEFFASHARLTLFPNLIAVSVRVTHLPLDWVLLVWHALSIFFLLLGCWHVGRLCFQDHIAQWGGVALVAALLTLPVAGTSLYLMDQYLTPRSLSTPAVIFIVVYALERKFLKMTLLAALTAAIHPLMVVFGSCFVGALLWTSREPAVSFRLSPRLGLLFPLIFFPPVSEAYNEVLQSRSYFFVTRWQWYEWLGIFGPLALLWWMGRVAQRRRLFVMHNLCRALIVFEAVFLFLGLAVSLTQLNGWGRLQPMRSLHLLYMVLFIFAGGLLAQSLLKNAWWQWVVLFTPICAGMFIAQRQIFPSSQHLEWPNVEPNNPWVESFLWIRDNTPVDAYFALDPDHMELPGEDEHSFRAIAQRSMLADRLKDSGAVSMFPALAEKWREQVRAQSGWKSFRGEDFQRLRQRFGVNWVVVANPDISGLKCPYQNNAVLVCRLKE